MIYGEFIRKRDKGSIPALPDTPHLHRPAMPIGGTKGVTFSEIPKNRRLKRGVTVNSFRKSTHLLGVITPERSQYGKRKK